MYTESCSLIVCAITTNLILLFFKIPSFNFFNLLAPHSSTNWFPANSAFTSNFRKIQIRCPQVLTVTRVPKPVDVFVRESNSHFCILCFILRSNLNANLRLLWPLPQHLLFDVCKHYFKKRSKIGEIYTCTLAAGVKNCKLLIKRDLQTFNGHLSFEMSKIHCKSLIVHKNDAMFNILGALLWLRFII